MTYDWGDRQQRVDYLLKRLRSLPPDKVIKGGTLGYGRVRLPSHGGNAGKVPER